MNATIKPTKQALRRIVSQASTRRSLSDEAFRRLFLIERMVLKSKQPLDAPFFLTGVDMTLITGKTSDTENRLLKELETEGFICCQRPKGCPPIRSWRIQLSRIDGIGSK